MGRWVAGLGVGALSVLVPLYMAETSPVPVRGAVIAYVLPLLDHGLNKFLILTRLADATSFLLQSVSSQLIVLTTALRLGETPGRTEFPWPLALSGL